MGFLIEYDDKNQAEEGHRLYRDTAPLDPQALPAPLVELGPNVEAYRDATVLADATYYYRASAYTGAVEKVSTELQVVAETATPPTDGLEVLYTMANMSADMKTLVDDQGLHNGLVSGCVRVPSPVGIKKALRFGENVENSNVDVVTMSSPGALIPSTNAPYTCCVWVSPSGVLHLGTYVNRVVEVFRTSEFSTFILALEDGGRASLYFSSSSFNTASDIYFTDPVKPGEFAHLTVVFDGSQCWLYRDGELDPASPVNAVSAASVEAYLGVYKPTGLTRNFAGDIGEFRWYTRALTPHEVKKVYNYGKRSLV